MELKMKKEVQDKWKKKAIPFREFKEVGSEIVGIYLGSRKIGEEINSKTGEIRDRVSIVFKEENSEEQFRVWENAGLKNALIMSDVKEGDLLKIVKLAKVKSKAGFDVNQYDIFVAE